MRATNLLVYSPASNDGGMLKTEAIVPCCQASDKQTLLFWVEKLFTHYMLCKHFKC